MNDTAKFVQRLGVLANHTFVHSALPEYLMRDPRWVKYTKPGLRGRGYWFWKAAILEHLLGDAPLGIQDGDWVIYADGDRHWLMRPLLNMAQKCEQAEASAVAKNVVGKKGRVLQGRALGGRKPAAGCPDLVAQMQPGTESDWTRGDVFGRFGVLPGDSHYGSTGQLKAQTFMVHVNVRTRTFARHWVRLCADRHLISGGPSISTKDSKGFKASREDQSLYSMLVKASLPGGCKNVRGSAQAPALGATCVHPEFGIPGLRVAFHAFRL